VHLQNIFKHINNGLPVLSYHDNCDVYSHLTNQFVEREKNKRTTKYRWLKHIMHKTLKKTNVAHAMLIFEVIFVTTQMLCHVSLLKLKRIIPQLSRRSIL